jgi:uncharacterized protein YgiB involved in biofilm formation
MGDPNRAPVQENSFAVRLFWSNRGIQRKESSMKRLQLKTMLAAAALVLMTASTTASAVCTPTTCLAGLENCIARGTNPVICEARYELCRSRAGCGPIP